MTQAANLAAEGSNVNSSGVLGVAGGGTGQTTQAGAANAILPTQTGNSGKYLTTDGSNTSWGTVTSNPGTVTSVAATGGTGISVTGSPITSSGTLNITNTGVTSVSAGTGISVSASTGGVTITNTAPASTSTGAIGTYFAGCSQGSGSLTTFNVGSTVSGSSLRNPIGAGGNPYALTYSFNGSYSPGFSGTWQAMGRSENGSSGCCGVSQYPNLWVRIS